MRKLLLGTSALIGATALVASASAAAPELTISGNLNFEWTGGENQVAEGNDSDDVADRGAGESGWEFSQANSLSEIKFHAEGESDGGLSYGAQIDYRYLNSSTDEAYIFISGDWGTLHLGQDDGAVNQTRFYAGSIAPGGFLIDGNTTALAPKSSTPYSFSAYSDNNKILYVSNDLNGFKFALSVEEAQSAAAVTDANFTIIETRDNAANIILSDAALVANRYAVQYEDLYEIGASYTAAFDGGSLGISVGYATADVADDDTNRVNAEVDVNDYEEYIVGVKGSFGDFSFAGSYADAGESGLTDSLDAAGAEAAKTTTLGVAYNIGGGMAVGISYAERERSLSRTQETSHELTALDFGFPIMEGMSGYAGIAFSEYDDDVATTSDPDATTYVIGTTVSF